MRLNLSEKQAQEILPGFHGKFVHSDSMTLAYWEIEGGSELPTHNHIHEQVLNMISGEFEFTMNGEVQVLRAGDVVVIPSDVPHSGKALTARSLMSFHHKDQSISSGSTLL